MDNLTLHLGSSTLSTMAGSRDWFNKSTPMASLMVARLLIMFNRTSDFSSRSNNRMNCSKCVMVPSRPSNATSWQIVPAMASQISGMWLAIHQRTLHHLSLTISITTGTILSNFTLSGTTRVNAVHTGMACIRTESCSSLATLRNMLTKSDITTSWLTTWSIFGI